MNVQNSINFLLFLTIDLLIVINSEQRDQSFEVNQDDMEVVSGDGGEVAIKVEEDVLVLTEDNFDLMVMSRPVILVEFYAPWCGHCKQLAPEYAKAAQMLKHNTPDIPLGKVDATVHEAIASRFQIEGYPTLLLFRNGTKLEYDGPRTAQGIVDYMKEKADPNWKPPQESVITLTKDNFDSMVANQDLLLVEFYAPWCGHCKQLAPEYERAAKLLSQGSKPVKLAKVDATVETELAQRYSVSGYPTLLLFRRGKQYKYNGPREEAGIVAYVKEQLISPSKVVTSVAQLKKELTPNWPTIVGLFDSPNHLFDTYIDSGYNERERNYKYLHIFDENVMKELKEKSNSIVLLQGEWLTSRYEPTRYRLPLDDSVSVQQISDFIGNNSLPLVGHRTYSSQWLYDKYPLVVVYYDVDFSFDNRKQTQLIREQVLKVAHELRDSVETFCIANEDDYVQELKDLKLDDSGEDVNVGYFESRKVRYSMEPNEDFDASALKRFVNSVRTGKIKRTIRSQPIPARNEGPVTVVVGETFESLVTNCEKNVLIEFYAPWCGHCKQLEPIYKELALKFVNYNNLIIAKIDANSNDYPEQYQVSGFPTIYFIRKSDKTSLRSQYQGDRSLEDLTKFVNSMLEHTDSARDEL